mgnify:CR=1 FL=1
MKLKFSNKIKKNMDEDLFCNYLRKNKQEKIINLSKKNKFSIDDLNLNWNYISLNDKLTINFISHYERKINFIELSKNKYLTSKHLEVFKHSLNWKELSKNYNFSNEDLKKFQKYIKWEYLFFYGNNPSNQYKIFYKNHMWWLFLNDKTQIDISKSYYLFNNKILNKNINKPYPDELIHVFNEKLSEYNNNLEALKNILKKQLLELYLTYESSEDIKQLEKVNCYDLNKRIEKELNIKKDSSIQTIPNVNYLIDIKDITETGVQTEDKNYSEINSVSENYSVPDQIEISTQMTPPGSPKNFFYDK